MDGDLVAGLGHARLHHDEHIVHARHWRAVWTGLAIVARVVARWRPGFELGLEGEDVVEEEQGDGGGDGSETTAESAAGNHAGVSGINRPATWFLENRWPGGTIKQGSTRSVSVLTQRVAWNGECCSVNIDKRQVEIWIGASHRVINYYFYMDSCIYSRCDYYYHHHAQVNLAISQFSLDRRGDRRP